MSNKNISAYESEIKGRRNKARAKNGYSLILNLAILVFVLIVFHPFIFVILIISTRVILPISMNISISKRKQKRKKRKSYTDRIIRNQLNSQVDDRRHEEGDFRRALQDQVLQRLFGNRKKKADQYTIR